MPAKIQALTQAFTSGTLADRAYQMLKRAILHGELPEGEFLREAEILPRYAIGRTPFREACVRLQNEQLLSSVARRGFLVPELTFRGVRDLLESRLLVEGIAAELAAVRAEAPEVEQLEDRYTKVLQAARKSKALDEVIDTNQRFHLQIGSMSHNREIENILRGLLERSVRLVYLAASSSRGVPADVESLLKPIVTAIGRRDPIAAQKAVTEDITRGQLNALGRDFWGETAERKPLALTERVTVLRKKEK